MVRTVVALELLAAAVWAQPVALKSPVTAPEQFSRIVSVRELADGRLLVSDRRDNRVVVLAFDGTPARQLGRLGSGPGEYRAAGALVPMPGDSTALADVGNGRYLLFSGPTVGGTIAHGNGFKKLPVIPAGFSRTHVYGYSYPAEGMGASSADTLALVRYSRHANSVDTVALLAAQKVRRAAQESTERILVTRISISPWSAGDQAQVFDDGWVAIARVDPYSVDWISPDGKRTRGKPLRASDPPFTDAEKRAFMERIAQGTGQPAAPITSRSDWPDVITAFTSATAILDLPSPALFAGPRGHLVIRRQPRASEPDQRYDVVDRSSAVVAQLTVGRNEVLVGVGQAHVYVAATDDDGIQRIRRYSWPLSPAG